MVSEPPRLSGFTASTDEIASVHTELNESWTTRGVWGQTDMQTDTADMQTDALVILQDMKDCRMNAILLVRATPVNKVKYFNPEVSQR